MSNDAAVSSVGQLPSAPSVGDDVAVSLDVAAVKWPWKLAARHVHFLKKDGSGHFLCWRGHAAKAADYMDGGDEIVAALISGRPACKRCLRALPASIREEVLNLSDAAGL